MGIFSRRNGREPPPSSLSLPELLDRYRLVEVNPAGHVLVADKEPGMQLQAVSDKSTTELGYAGTTSYHSLGRDEYNPELRGWLGLRRWDEMRRGDGTVRSALRIIKTPIYAARWFVEPASQSKQDLKVADFIEQALFCKMTVSWPQLLTEICLHLDFGNYSFEKVFAFDQGKVIWQKWAPRHPMAVYEWKYDEHGGPLGMWTFSQSSSDGRVFIPIEKLLVFTNEKEAGNMEGISILRSGYKHWFYADNLYKIDAIQKERHGIGIPVIKLPPNFNDQDKLAADQMGANLRTNEKAHIVLPPMWDVITLKIEGQPVDALSSAMHHENRLMESVLAGFMSAKTTGAGLEVKADLFSKSTRFIAEQIRDVINKWAIPELVDYNWKTVTEYPEVRVRRIGETVDWQKISFALRNMVGAGILQPDDELEEWIRNEMDLPNIDPTSIRVQATPQMPGGGGSAVAGPPKQSLAKNSTQGKTTGSSKIGGPGGNNQG